MTVPAQVEQDDPRLAGFPRRQGLVDRDLDRVGRLRRGQDPLGTGELDARREARALVDALRLDEVVLLEQAHQGRHPVVAETAGVDGLRDEVRTEGVHLHDRGHLAGVAEVVGVDAAGQARRGLGLDGDDPVLGAVAEVPAEEREGQPGEVRAAAGAPDDDVGRLAGHAHLLDRLLPDDRLVEQDVVEHGAERVLGVVTSRRILDRLADRHPERTGAVRRLGEDRAPVVGRERRAGHDLRAVRLHEDPPVRLLVVARADHVDLDLEVEQGAGERERAAPLAGTGLGREAGDPLLLVVIRLRDRGVRLVAAGRAATLVLVVDVGRGIEHALQPVGAEQRARPVEPIRVADGFRDLDLALGRDLLTDERHREERSEVGRPDRLVGPRMEGRERRRRADPRRCCTRRAGSATRRGRTSSAGDPTAPWEPPRGSGVDRPYRSGDRSLARSV